MLWRSGPAFVWRSGTDHVLGQGAQVCGAQWRLANISGDGWSGLVRARLEADAGALRLATNGGAAPSRSHEQQREEVQAMQRRDVLDAMARLSSREVYVA
jgi:hypothetical protein